MSADRTLTTREEQRLLARVKRADEKMKAAKAERIELLREARAAGVTWRTLALTLDMTVEGVTKILERAKKDR